MGNSAFQMKDQVLIMYCRTHQRRKEIVKDYIVIPVAHVKLLPNQHKLSDASHKEMKNQYYLFKATNRQRQDDVEYIQCGLTVAKDFLNLIGAKGLPLFNPLQMNDQQIRNGNHNAAAANQNIIQWNDEAKQLSNAIMWIFVLRDQLTPDGSLGEISSKINKYYDRSPFDSQIKGVNTIIRKLFDGETLVNAINQKVEELNIDINQRKCDFSLLNDRIAQINKKSEDNITSYFS